MDLCPEYPLVMYYLKKDFLKQIDCAVYPSAKPAVYSIPIIPNYYYYIHI